MQRAGRAAPGRARARTGRRGVAPGLASRQRCVRVGVSLLPILVAVLANAASAEARCRNVAEMAALGRAVDDHVACTLRRLSGGTCRPSAPAPACGAGLPEAVTEALLGPVPLAGAWSTDAHVCQVELGRAARRYVRQRLGERLRQRRATSSAAAFARVSTRCGAVQVESDPGAGTLPRLGRGCDAGAPGDTVAVPSVLRCLRATLEQVVDAVAPEPLRPNVVLVITDDQRADTLDFMPETLERIAARGSHFVNAFTTSPVCAPSRATLMSGRLPHHQPAAAPLGFDQQDTLATWLAAAGYRNGILGKYTNSTETLGEVVPAGWTIWNVFLGGAGGGYYDFEASVQGFFASMPRTAYSTDLLGPQAAAFVQGSAAVPFLLVVAPFAPHMPAIPAERHAGALAGLDPWRPPSWHEADLSTKPTWVSTYRALHGTNGTALRDTLRQAELETLLAVDEAVASIDDALERAGISDQTLVLYLSDHGIHWGEHWLPTKWSSYEESIRIPLLMRWPMLDPPGGRVHDRLVAMPDVSATVAAVAGVSGRVPDGIDLVGALRAGGPERDAVLVQSPGEFFTRPNRAVRTERWKWIETDASSGVTEELYDLENDPFELTNRAADPALGETSAALRALLDELLGS